MKNSIILVATLLSVALAGCGGNPRRADSEVDYANTKAKLQPFASQAAVAPRAALQRVKAAATLPAEFEETVTLNRGDIPTVDDLARRMTRLTGFPVRLSREVEEYLNSKSSRGRDANRPPVINPNSSAISFNDDTTMYAMSFTGSKKGLYDAVAARLGCYWRYDKGTIQLYMTDTRTFFIPALPSTSSSKETSKASEGSGARSEVEVTANQSIWSELEKTIKSMLSGLGRVVVSPSNGSLVVTDTPDSLERVSKFVDEQKRFLSRQVALEVQVFNLTLSDESAFGIDLNLAMNHLNRYGVSLVSGAGQANATGSGSAFSFSVLDSATGEAGKFRGSSVILNALQGQGAITNSRTANLVTLNNHAAPLRIGRTTGYLAQSTIATTANVGTSASLSPGTVPEGYSINLIPTILENDSVLLQLTMNITQLRQIRSIVSGNNKIEVPETEDSNTIQRTILQNGTTLMLAGFEQETRSNNDNLGIMSFGTKNARGRTLLVVLVTPTISAQR